MEFEVKVKINPKNTMLCGRCQFITDNDELTAYCTLFGISINRDSKYRLLRCDVCKIAENIYKLEQENDKRRT